jgi:phosphoribosylanthranilate isomerase
MPLKTLVKVGSITNLSDARYCAGMGVDMLGFRVMEDQDNHIAAGLFQQIRGWVSGPRVVVEIYGVKKTTDIEALLKDYAPEMVELSFSEYQLYRSQIQLPFIVHLESNELENIREHHKRIAYWQVDESSMKALAKINGPQPVLLRTGSKEKIESLFPNDQIKGVSLTGSPELRPGFKEYDDLSEILEILEEE